MYIFNINVVFEEHFKFEEYLFIEQKNQNPEQKTGAHRDAEKLFRRKRCH